jgi:hypothetical protein
MLEKVRIVAIAAIVIFAGYWVFTYEKVEVVYQAVETRTENYNVNHNENLNLILTLLEVTATRSNLAMGAEFCRGTNDIGNLFNRLSVFQQLYSKVLAIGDGFVVYYPKAVAKSLTNKMSATFSATNVRAVTNRSRWWAKFAQQTGLAP